MNSIHERLKKIKSESFKALTITPAEKNEALSKISHALSDNKEFIFAENQKDLLAATKASIPTPVLKRLLLDESKLNDLLKGISDLIAMEEPCFKTTLKRELDKNLILERVTCPIGLIGVIFEARPDALVQITSLCIKTANYVILKGGSEAKYTNKDLPKIISDALSDTALSENFVTLLENRDEIKELLTCHDCIDLLIPRGSNEFVQYLMENTKIPVMGHADGICHVYVDEFADIKKAIQIIKDSKTQYVAACNTVETVLIHESIAAKILPDLNNALKSAAVKILGCPETEKYLKCEKATEDDFKTEYLDYIVSIKVIKNIDEAISHINKYGSHHTDAIITENDSNAKKFMLQTDSAGVYRNCSTRFADGYRYGFGAEVGISTGKLHARGPVGLDGLLTYKYFLSGDGHIVNDYASGKSSFNFKNL